LEDIYSKNDQIIQNKDIKIKLLEEEIMKLSSKDTIPYSQIFKELQFHFNDLSKYSFAKQTEIIKKNGRLVYQEIPVFLVHFNEAGNAERNLNKINEIEKWLRVRLNDEKILVLESSKK